MYSGRHEGITDYVKAIYGAPGETGNGKPKRQKTMQELCISLGV